MTSDKRNLDFNLDRLLGLFSAPSSDQLDASRAQIQRCVDTGGIPAAGACLAERPSVRHGWRFVFVGVMATAALVFGVILVWPQRALVETAGGGLYRVSGEKSQPLTAGGTVELGDVLRTNEGASSVVVLPDGSHIEMRARSELSMESAHDGLRIHLIRGGVIVNAAKQLAGHLYVQTKDVTVSVVGTVFLVNTEEAGSRVAVIEGEVHVQQGAISKKLLPGEVSTSSLMKSQPITEEISWSRNAAALAVLLAQSTAIESPSLRFEAATIKPEPEPGIGTYVGGSTVGPVLCRGVDGLLGQTIPGTLLPLTVPQGRCVGKSVSLAGLIRVAYGSRNVSGGPDWAYFGETFRIEAKAENVASVTKDQLRQMLQTLIAEQFKLKVLRDTKEVQGYALVALKTEPKLKESLDTEEPLTLSLKTAGGGGRGAGGLSSFLIKGKTSLNAFSAFLGACAFGGLIVVDKTNLAGNYEFALTLNPVGYNGGPCSPDFDPSLPRAIENQLGLVLESQKVSEPLIVIQHAEMRSEN
jgi:uncharacterized protein (TIGR03435 family)